MAETLCGGGVRSMFLLAFAAVCVPHALFAADVRDTEPTTDAETLRLHWQYSVEAYTYLTGVEPDTGQARFRLGRAHFHNGDHAPAIEALERAERLGFDLLASRFHLAAANELLGDREQADRWLRRARSVRAAAGIAPGLLHDPRLESLFARERAAERILRRSYAVGHGPY